jgi:hypothetical protein
MEFPALLLNCTFDDRTAWEIEQKGFCDIATVVLENHVRYEVHFYDPKRLAYELETEIAHGKHCVADRGMIVIPKVTRHFMEQAVRQLAKQGYFSSLVPLS